MPYLQPLLFALVCLVMSTPASSQSASELSRYLTPTLYLDIAHPEVIAATNAAMGAATTDTDRAIRIHDYVRDNIRFGWAPAFYDQKASEVLRTGVGYCNTKSTLFVAMLRVAGIPARQHFVNIDARILDGLINPGGSYVDHSYAEIYLGGRWLSVDSYILDLPLADRARARLKAESKLLGYGAHRDGVSVWDGRSDAFAQFVTGDGATAVSTKDHGVFEDVGAFYRSGLGVNRLNLPLRLVFGWFSRRANITLETIRSED